MDVADLGYGAMSYARFGCDGSDVYVYASGDGVVTCCGCSLGDSWNFALREMVAHLREHEARGDHVPKYVFERLERELAEDSE